MPLAIDTIAGTATNPGAGGAALAAVTGDSYVVRSFDFSQAAYIDNVWRLGAAAGFLRVRSPRLHDNVQGIRLRGLAADPSPLFPYELDQRLEPQDTLIAEISGGGAEVDAGYLSLYYNDLPGISARLATWEAVMPQIVNIVGNEVSTTTAGTAGVWADTAINSTFDLLKANVNYALLGYVSDTAVGAIGLKGVDTGNLRICGPGTNARVETREWYIWQARQNARPWIPIFNAANKGSTFVSVSHTATSATVIVNLILAELSGAPA